MSSAEAKSCFPLAMNTKTLTSGMFLLVVCLGADGQSIKRDQKALMRLNNRQQQALKLLQSSTEVSSAFSPEMKTFVLWKIAEAYGPLQPERRESLLADAFRASVGIQEIRPDYTGCNNRLQGCGIKVGLQTEILTAIKSIPRILDLVPSAEPEAQLKVKRSLVLRYVGLKEYGKAQALVDSLAADGDYPYKEAMELMFVLPQRAAAKKLLLFSQALAFYKQHDEPPFNAGYDDFTGMILRFGHELPAAIILDAIDTALQKSKEATPSDDQFHITVSSYKGSASFASEYEYRLFQFLPLLQELDSTKAERLLRDDREMRGILDTYPSGLAAIAPDPHFSAAGEKQSNGTVSVSMGTGAPVVGEPVQQIHQAVLAQEADILNEAKRSPGIAVSHAESLPACLPIEGAYGPQQQCPRAETLLQIASESIKDVDVAKDALNQARKSIDEALPVKKAMILNGVIGEYLRLNFPAEAQATLKQARATAGSIYKLDTDTDNPNLVFKPGWPSTNEWLYCIERNTAAGSTDVEPLLADIPDPEIEALGKVFYARAMLGLQDDSLQSEVSNKEENFGVRF